MAKQRLVVWCFVKFSLDERDQVINFDLDYHSLKKTNPSLAEAIGPRGRVISHNIVHWGQCAPTISFIVEDD